MRNVPFFSLFKAANEENQNSTFQRAGDRPKVFKV